MNSIIFSLFLIFVSVVLCDDQLLALQPPSLVSKYQDGVIPEVPALFGSPPMGQSISGQIVWATPGDLDGCQPINKTLNPLWPKPPTAAIVMVDRGNCTFVTKVRNVQNAGGQAAIVTDNVDETFIPYMADDGTGSDIFIPSVLIKKADGQNIKTALSDTNVLVKMSWALPNPDNRVEWRLWTSSNDQASVAFKQVFGTAVRSLGNASQFEPKYVILDGTEALCNTPDLPCGSQCTNHGRYCASDPDGDLSSGISGADIVTENLRELCIFQVLNSSQYNDPYKWWDYVSAYSKCNPMGLACSNAILAQLKINNVTVQNCVNASGGVTADADNILLEAQLKGLVDDGVFYIPTMFINDVAYRGSLTCTEPINVNWCAPLATICAGYATGTEPCTCTSDAGCQLCQNKDGCGVCLTPGSKSWNKSCAGCDGKPYSAPCSSSSGMSTGGVVAIVLICMLVIAVGVYFAFRSYKNRMEKHIDNLLRQYQPVDKKEKLLESVEHEDQQNPDHPHQERVPLTNMRADDSSNV